jgi:hypothetical protein
MSNLMHTIKRELWHAVPPTLFFFFAFNIILITNALSLMGHGIHVRSMFIATALALLAGKAIPLADHLPFVNKFPDKPLIYNIVWKTGIYMVVVFLARYVEHFIPFLIEDRGFMAAHEHLFSEVIWPRFWAIQIWLVVLFCMYATIVELVRTLGKERMITMFFGRKEETSVIAK